MIKSKAVDILKSLNKDELKELGEFITSPYFNKNKNVIALFGELKKFYPSFESRNMTKENVYSKIFPGNVYADKTFRNLMSDLLGLIEKYMVINELDSNKLYEKYLLTQSLSKKRLIRPAEQSLREADKIFDEELFDGGNIFYTRHLLEMEKDFIEIHKNNVINLNMKEGEYMVYSFLSKYMLFRMKLANYKHKMDTQQASKFINEFNNRVDLKPWVEYMEQTGGWENEIILIYYYSTVFMENTDDDASFNKALGLFYKNKTRLNITETLNLYLTFTGFCAVKMARGEKQYTEVLFNLYVKMGEENLLMGVNEEYMHITIFNNVFNTALMLGKLEWSKAFIDEYAPKLLPEYRDVMFNYAYAWYYFAAKNYEYSLEHLGKVTLENTWLKARTRMLQIRLYYELGHAEAFFSFHDAFKHFLKSDKEIPEYSRNADNLFITMLNKLARVKFSISNEPHDEQLKKLSLEAESTLKGTLKDWFTLKIAELEV